MKKNRKLLFALAIPFTISALVLAFLFFTRETVPIEGIEESRKVISQAVKKGARLYAPEELARSENYMKQLLEEWRTQNEKPVYKRRYHRVEELASLSVSEGKNAIIAAEKNRKQIEQQISEKMNSASASLQNFEEKFYRLPLPEKIKQNFISAKMLYTEAESALQRDDKLAAAKKIGASLGFITKANSDAHTFISEYFSMFSSWKKWVRETIQWSANSNDYAIVVDKLAHTCTLFKSGQVYKVYEIEMGPNWIGDKEKEGDKATPEGKYYVTKKLEKPRTIYHKALLINYPNEEDKNSFSLNMKNGALPRGSQIGSLIEIHGHGGKGTHWTDGCVALENRDMDNLFKYTRVGTPVTIVGSTKPFSQIFD